MAYGIGAHGIWHHGHLPSKFGCLPNVIGLQNRVTLTFVAPGYSLSGVLGRAFGRPVATQSCQRRPQSRHIARQRRQNVPDVVQRRPGAKNHGTNSPKHVPEQRQTMKNQGFPKVFVHFAERACWGSRHRAFGPWPSKFGCLPNVLRLQN